MVLSKFRSSLLGTAKIDAAAKNSKEVLLPKAVFRRKILNEPFCVAKFLSKGRLVGYWGKAPRSYTNQNLLCLNLIARLFTVFKGFKVIQRNL